MTNDRQLHPGGTLGLSLAAGTEVVCTSGLLYLTATGPWLGQAWARRALPVGQAWRAGESQWVQLQAGDSRAFFRVIAPPPAAEVQPPVTAPRWSSSVPGMCRS
jgi:hypothetical protein